MKQNNNIKYASYDASKYVDRSYYNHDIQELDKTPVYIPYNVSYRKTRSDGATIKEGSAYLKRYYSSIDAEIYFNNEYVEDIADIEWEVIQTTKQIFGYNSYTTDEYAVGNRIIKGKLFIRFTSPNYLFQILDAAKNTKPLVESQKSLVLPTHERNTLQDTIITRNTNNNDVGEYRADKFTYLWKPLFDIDIIFGQKSPGGEQVHIILEDVKLLYSLAGVGVDNPSAVTEMYEFVAKDIRYIK